MLGRVHEPKQVWTWGDGGKGMCLSHTEFADKGEDTKTDEVIRKIQGSKVRLGLAYRRLQWRNFLSSLSCRRLSGSLIMQTAQISRISPKCSLFRPAGEVSAQTLKATYLPLRLILHTCTPSHSTCCQLSSLLLSGVSGTHIHLPLPCCCHCICCSVSVFSSAWGVCIDLQTPELLSDIKLCYIALIPWGFLVLCFAVGGVGHMMHK